MDEVSISSIVCTITTPPPSPSSSLSDSLNTDAVFFTRAVFVFSCTTPDFLLFRLNVKPVFGAELTSGASLCCDASPILKLNNFLGGSDGAAGWGGGGGGAVLGRGGGSSGRGGGKCDGVSLGGGGFRGGGGTAWNVSFGFMGLNPLVWLGASDSVFSETENAWKLTGDSVLEKKRYWNMLERPVFSKSECVWLCGCTYQCLTCHSISAIAKLQIEKTIQSHLLHLTTRATTA